MTGDDKRDGAARSTLVLRYSMLWLGLASPLMAQQVEEDIRGAKPLIEIPEPLPETPWQSYIIWVLVAVLIIAVLVWAIKRRTKPGLTEEDRAKQELDRLGRDGTNLEAGDFALAASQVVRVFIERKFGLAAPKRTTEEFLQELAVKDSQALSSRMDPLRGFLKSCDMAKFAGADLGIGERGELVARARAFVDATESSKGKEAA